MTSDFYTLSRDQLERYTEDGYVIIRKFFEKDLLDTYRKRTIDICNGEVKIKNYLLFKQQSLRKLNLEGEAVVNKIHNIETDEVFNTYYENPRLLDVVSQLVGENIMLVHAMAINKPPGSEEHYPHQDLHYAPLRPADKVIGTWTAVDPVTVDNGCLYVVPGSHKSGELYPHSKLPDADILYHVVEGEKIRAPVEKRVNLVMSPGDVVIFHSLLIHGSRPNVSKTFRKAISCHYASCECSFIQLEGTPQEHVAIEAQTMLKKKGFCGNYTESYRQKSRVVRGKGLNVL